ncbi:MAG: hypothetical protein FJZ16_00875 [Candidatus Omnitrophica bacterium]|nr:hypothetical protein [Candidatus Omnitrophota bacterium]
MNYWIKTIVPVLVIYFFGKLYELLCGISDDLWDIKKHLKLMTTERTTYQRRSFLKEDILEEIRGEYEPTLEELKYTYSIKWNEISFLKSLLQEYLDYAKKQVKFCPTCNQDYSLWKDDLNLNLFLKNKCSICKGDLTTSKLETKVLRLLSEFKKK